MCAHTRIIYCLYYTIFYVVSNNWSQLCDLAVIGAAYAAQPQPTAVIVTQPTQPMPYCGEYPVAMTCPSCKFNITTRTTYHNGTFAWLLCLLICCVGFVRLILIRVYATLLMYMHSVHCYTIFVWVIFPVILYVLLVTVVDWAAVLSRSSWHAHKTSGTTVPTATVSLAPITVWYSSTDWR